MPAFLKNVNAAHVVQAALMCVVGYCKSVPASPVANSVEQMALGALGVLAFVSGSVLDAPAPKAQ